VKLKFHFVTQYTCFWNGLSAYSPNGGSNNWHAPPYSRRDRCLHDRLF